MPRPRPYRYTRNIEEWLRLERKLMHDSEVTRRLIEDLEYEISQRYAEINNPYFVGPV